MRINTNLNAMTALNNATKNTALAGSSMEKLSSGLKINKAADNATGLAISEKMRSQIRGLDQASQNTQDGISVVQTAEGAIEEVGNIVQRMRELSVQSANETNTGSDRTKISEELTQLHEEIDRISQSTQFNGKDLLNGNVTVRTETNIKGTANANKVSDIKIDNGFDFDQLQNITNNTGEVKINTVTNDSKIQLNGQDLPLGYGFSVDNGIENKGQQEPKIKSGSTITITDTNGKKFSFKAGEDITKDSGTTKLLDLSTETKNISGKEISLQVGANTGDSQTLKVKIENVSTKSLGIDTDTISKMAKEGTKGTEAANKMIENLDKALERVNTSRANLGAMQNRLETTSSNLTTSSENLTAAE